MGRGAADRGRVLAREEVSQVSDIVDLGNETAETFLNASLTNLKPVPPPHGVGLCLNCGAAVEGDKRWCDPDCLKDWERANHCR